ncbi:MAG: hypothetical protein ACLFVQ_07885 [Chitinispirillaceae bacterium]
MHSERGLVTLLCKGIIDRMFRADGALLGVICAVAVFSAPGTRVQKSDAGKLFPTTSLKALDERERQDVSPPKEHTRKGFPSELIRSLIAFPLF